MRLSTAKTPGENWTDLMGFGRDPWPRLWGRRAVTIPLHFVLWGLVVGLTPVLLPVAILLDAARPSNWTKVRSLVFFLLYLSCEVVGILASFMLWLLAGPHASKDVEKYLWRNFALQCWWARTLGGGALRLFSIRLEVEGLEDLRERPILLFVRHVSTADTVLPAMLIAVPQKILLRYVLKRELLLDPCLDIVGNRLPNYFARRGSGEREKEISAVAQLMKDLKAGHGVLIYPEGTRFSPSKRQRILERLEQSGNQDALERARRMSCVLPPHLGGSLALLERNLGADAVFFAHTGFESTMSFAEVWRGGLVGSRVRVKVWVVPYEKIPEGREALSEWLWNEWAKVNAFVEGAR